MKLNHFFMGVVVMVALFLVLRNIGGYGYIFGYKSTIQELVAKDHELSQLIYTPSEDITDEKLDSHADSIRQYTQAAREYLRTIELPADIAVAYNNHLNAWDAQSRSVARHPIIGTFASNFWEGFFVGLTGDITGGALKKNAEFNKWGKELKNCDENVDSTWSEFESVASKYGVQP